MNDFYILIIIKKFSCNLIFNDEHLALYVYRKVKPLEFYYMHQITRCVIHSFDHLSLTVLCYDLSN